MTSESERSRKIEGGVETQRQKSEVGSVENVIADTKQQALLNDALKNDPNKIPEGDSIGGRLVALKPGMTVAEAQAAQAKVDSFGIDFGDGNLITAADKKRLSLEENQVIAQLPTTSDATKDSGIENKVEGRDKIENSYPDSSDGWRERFAEFDRWVQERLKLDHKPNHEDYGKIVNEPYIDEEKALCAALKYSFGMRARGAGESVEEFAMDQYKDMLQRGKLYELKPADADEVNPNLMSQKFFDSCVMMTSVMQLANTSDGRKQLLDMVKENDDGTFTVTFPGKKNEPELVKGLTPAEKMLACESGTGHIYLALIEKAIGQICIRNTWSPLDKDPIVRADGLSEALNNNLGVNFKTPGELVTGHGFDELRGPNEKEAQELIEKALKENRVAILGVLNNPPKNSDLHGHHAYLITKSDSTGVDVIDPIDRKQGRRSSHLTWAQVKKLAILTERSK
jgi:hypothetical protein